MAARIDVSDGASNAAENVEYAAKAIGSSEIRQKIFAEVYRGSGTWKKASAIATRIGLERLRLIKEIRPLVNKGVVLQEKRGGEICYGMGSFNKAHRDEILKYARDLKRLETLPTKRRPQVQMKVITRQSVSFRPVIIPVKSFDVRRVSVDDIDSFAEVKAIPAAGNLAGMSEGEFKTGIQSILGQTGEFKDWGGEKSDLFSTNLRFEGRRLAAAFAFKGPGLAGKLTMARMGKNGDQGPRLFQEPAEIFLVQHWREIDPQVLELLQSLAIARSATMGKPVFFGVIDGQDSDRLVRAYPEHFSKKKNPPGHP